MRKPDLVIEIDQKDTKGKRFTAVQKTALLAQLLQVRDSSGKNMIFDSKHKQVLDPNRVPLWRFEIFFTDEVNMNPALKSYAISIIRLISGISIIEEDQQE